MRLPFVGRTSVSIRGTGQELVRRKVIRALVAYSAVAWLVLEVSSAVLPLFDVPDWSLRLLVMVLAVGFPVAAVLAWMYDITPRGVVRTEAAVEAVPGSVAVLPFIDTSATSGFQYLGDGIASELISMLARRAGVRVAGRTSSFATHRAALDAREIGEHLGVRHIVEGSVSVTGDRLEVTVQIVDAGSGYIEWSEKSAGELADVLGVQDRIAAALIRAVAERVTPPRTAARGTYVATTANADAYACYLRGRALWNDRTPSSLRHAIQHFNEATSRDPGFAHAFAGLADCYAILAEYAIVAPALALPQARAAAERALSLAAGLPESHTSAALVHQMQGDLRSAERGHRRALEIDPDYPVARHRLAMLLTWTGRSAEARRELERAAVADPFSPLPQTGLGWLEYYDGRHDEACAVLRTALHNFPHFTAAQVPLVLSLLRAGQAAAALEVADAHLAAVGPVASATALHIVALAAAGDIGAARAAQDRLERSAQDTWVSPYYRAVAALGVGAADTARTMLEAALDENAPQLIQVARDPFFEPLRGSALYARIDARYQPA